MKSRGRGPIDPNWKCHFTGLPSRRCLCSPGCGDIISTFLAQLHCLIFQQLFHYVPLCLDGRVCAVVVSNQSARKLQQQSKIEVIAQEWTNWNRLLWNLQAFADTCWTQHSMSSLLPYYPSSQLPWQQLMGRENISQLFALLLLSFITWVNDMKDRWAS